jgi:hypothetical protein
VDVIRSFQRLEKHEYNYSLGGSFEKSFALVSIDGRIDQNWGEGFQIINSTVLATRNSSTTLLGSLNTFFEKFPNFNLFYLKTFSTFQNSTGSSDFVQDKAGGSVTADFGKHYSATFEYGYNYFKGEQTNTSNSFQTGGFDINYVNPDKNWSFNFNISNLFDNEFIQRSSINDFIVSDTRSFIMPRIFLLSATYKL